MSETTLVGLQQAALRVLATNTTSTTALATPSTTTTAPTAGDANSSFALLGASFTAAFVLTNANNEDGHARVGVWKHWNDAGTSRYFALPLADLVITAGNLATGATTEFFADTITVTTVWYPNNVIVSPTGDTGPATIQFDNLDAEWGWVAFDCNAGGNASASMNAVYWGM